MIEQDSIRLEVSEGDGKHFHRLDQFLASKVNHVSRTFIKCLFQKKMIVAEDSPVRLSLNKMPPAGTILQIMIPAPVPSDIQAENLPLEILYQDEHLLFVHKRAGMVTHPAPGHPGGTLANAILHHCPDLKGVGDTKKPGIVHRLDKGTSGVMVVAKTGQCHEGLGLLFSEHRLDRVYRALVMGRKMPPTGHLKGRIGRDPRHRTRMAIHPRGRDAVTNYKVLEYFQRASHLELTLETGRTHQIRVHLSSLLKTPIVCDALYGNPAEHLARLGAGAAKVLGDYPHPLLHAQKLGLVHPITKKKLAFEVPVPQVFERTLEVLRGTS